MYSINNYTEKECFKILGLDVDIDPTDDELENSIKTQKNKYAQISNERGKNLLTFFNDMYNRFFEPEEQPHSDDEESDDEESDEEQQINDEIRPYRNQVFDQRNDVFYANNVYEGFNTNQSEGYSDPPTGVYKTKGTDEDGNPDDEHTYKYDFEVKGDELLLLPSETSEISYNNGDSKNFNYTESGEGDKQKIVFAESINAYDSNSDNYENVSITKNIEHTPGQLNPLLKETIKRTIYINSQDRDQVFDDNNALTTDFHFYLEETLRNVVSLKLYAVQIPYTWYTIDSRYGSNFFYLKSDTPGITNKDIHEYKVEIFSGNYSPQALVTAINEEMISTLLTDHPDISFGNTGISYNSNTAKPTITVDIEKVYDASEFEITMSDYQTDDSFNSIAKFLGFTQKNENIVHTLETTSNKPVGKTTYISFSIVRYSIVRYTPADEEELFRIVINDNDISIGDCYKKLNAQLFQSDYINGDVSYNENDSSYNWTWNIEYNRHSHPMKQNQKLFIKAIDISSRQYFGFDASYTELNPYILYGNVEGQSATITNISGVHIILRNNWIRDVMCVSDLSFEGTVDFKIEIDNSNGMVTKDLISHVKEEFNNKTNNITEIQHSTCALFFASEENEIINVFNIDISINHTIDGSSAIFEKDPSSGGIVVDFSGFLYDRLFFRTKETTYDICGSIHTGTELSDDLVSGAQSVRTTVSMNVLEDRTIYTYTSIHPKISTFLNDKTDNGFNKNVLRIKSNDDTNYSDFSFNLDFSDFSYSSIFNQSQSDLSHVVFQNNTDLYGILKIEYTKSDHGTIGGNGFPLSIDDISFNNNITDVTYQLDSDDAMQKSTLNISFFKSFQVTDYKIELRDNENDQDFTADNSQDNIWKTALSFPDLSTNFNDFGIIKEGRIRSGNISLNQHFVGKDQTITIKPKSESDIEGVIPIILDMNGIQNEPTDKIIEYINTELSNNIVTHGSTFEFDNDNSKLKIKMHINQVFTSRDYKLVFFDDTDFIKCNASIKYTRNVQYNTTLGYILGYRNFTEYQLNNLFVYASNVITRPNNAITITSDAVLSVYIYNTLMIVIEDFNQSHINDKVVSVSQRDTKINMQNRKSYKCNPYTSVIQSRKKSLTQNQLYSIDAITRAQTETQIKKSTTQSHRDVFAVVPIKSGLSPGETFVEFGGTLQSQERTYFGPVNISRLRIKLMTDKGDIINLNGAHWSFQLICETLYKS